MNEQEWTIEESDRTASTNRDAMEDEPSLRIAIVGAGPRGLYSLERIFHYANKIPSRQLHVCLYDSSREPGAGKVYGTDQPDWLLMNYSSKNIDAWFRDDAGVDGEHLSLVEWLERDYPEWADPDRVVPRRITGEYLIECYQQVLNEKPENVTFEQKSATAKDILRAEDHWKVLTVEESQAFDEVLLCLGHGQDVMAPESLTSLPTSAYGSRLGQSQTEPEGVVGSTYPVKTQLKESRVPADCKVAVRGFGLTFIDACLSLTAGRGGQFEVTDSGDWSYEPKGREPEMIYPYSRTGRPMLAKPDYRKIELKKELDELWENGNRRLRELEATEWGFDFEDQIKPILLETAARALEIQCADASTANHNRRSVSAASMGQWLAGWCADTIYPGDIFNRMSDSYLTAIGRRPVDEAWALGEAWRQLYPALVERVSYGGLSESSWELFRFFAAEMERIAFGPPADSVGKLLALIKSGLIELRFLTGAPVAFSQHRPLEKQSELVLRNEHSQVIVDCLVNAVLPAAEHAAEDSLLYNLLQRQSLSRFRNTGGVAVNQKANALDQNEKRVPGLSVIGRPTEGCVLGNDTLSRTLHPESDRWAKRIVNSLTTKTPNQHKLKRAETDLVVKQA